MAPTSGDTLVVETSREIKGGHLMHFSCVGCGECCHLRIPVTQHDVIRMRQATGKKVDELIEFVPVGDFKGVPDDLSWIWFSSRRADRRVMCVIEVDGHCQFLGPDMRCQQYACRPLVCRTHPFVLELDDQDKNIECIEHNDGCECAGSRDDFYSEDQLVEMHNSSMKEDVEFSALVAQWNRSRRQRSEQEFLRYLGLI